jgi:hypothetical protein
MKYLSTTILILSLGSPGCAAMTRAWVAQNCNREAAYAAGMNAAKDNQSMSQNFGALCDPGIQGTVQAAYREGYAAGAGSGAQVNVSIAATAERECISAYGKEACGYGCVQAYGEVKCAARPGDSCLESYGKIVCGTNCQKKAGTVVCQ